MSSQPQPSAQPSISAEIDNFVDHVEALRITSPLAMIAAEAARKELSRKQKEYLDTHGEIEKVTEDEATYRVQLIHLREVERLRREGSQVGVGITLLPTTFVVALVSQFDFFLGRLLRWFYFLKPDALNASEKQIAFSDLLKFGSIEAAKEFLLEKEIETFLRASHAEQFRLLEMKLSIPLRKDLDVWPQFIEVTERRNLFVHTGGVISHQYLATCREHSVELDPNLVVGTKLDATPRYFSSAVACLFEIGVKLAQVMWRKSRPDDLQAADSNLVGVTYRLLEAERWDLATNLLDFACLTLKQHSSDQNRRILVVNRAQCYKWRGKNDVCQSILDKEDWSACGGQFRLAVEVLRNKFESAEQIMAELGPSGYVNEASYRDWPLFREFRQSPEFLRGYKKVFGHDYAEATQKTAKPDK